MRLFEALDGERMACLPVIGITSSPKEDAGLIAQHPLGRFARADLDYIDGVSDAGGVPVVVPPATGFRAAEALLDRLDGLQLSGGTDLEPDYYGEQVVPELGLTIPERDACEMILLRMAMRRRIPIFGICRGMQILNVALGGTLYQDFPSQLDLSIEHSRVAPKWQPVHEAEVRRGSWLGEVTGSLSVGVNSYHHQGIKTLGTGLVASAVSPDQVIEAIEWRNMSVRWLFGVQWHPEGMRGTSSEHQDLFEAHVRAAERHAMRRAAA
jgi:putative glutamine amidotransferase